MQAVCADFPQAYCWRINSFLFAARLRKPRRFNEALLPKVVFLVRMIAAHVRVLMPGLPIFFYSDEFAVDQVTGKPRG